MTGTMKTMLGVAATFAVAASANAAISTALLGSAAPPATIGGLAFTAAAADTQPTLVDVSSMSYKPGSSVGFSPSLSHRLIGAGWGSWSHGYMGDVYYTNGATSATMTFTQTDLFGWRFYVESNPFGLFTATVVATNAAGETSTSTQSGDGLSGAVGFGVTSTSRITSITVSMGSDFAIGEFGYSKVPAPGALALLGIAGLAGRRRRA